MLRAVAVAGLILNGCDTGNPTEPGSPVEVEPTPPPAQSGPFSPSVGATWHWQLDGPVNTSYDVEVYDIDLFDASASLIGQLRAQGRTTICYFSAGSFEPNRPDSDQFRSVELGLPLEGFSDERWLDIRSENVLEIMRARLSVAATKGCDGVEPDNVDGYANDTGFPLTGADQLTFNRFLADEAHSRGLSVGLKNDIGQIDQLVADFDFSLNEQCHEFSECQLLEPSIRAGKPVFNAEYLPLYVNDAAERQRLCADSRSRGFSTLILPLELDDSFRLSCD